MTFVPRPARLIALAAAALLTSACAAQGPGAQSTSPAPSPSATASQTASQSADAGLVKATHPQCDTAQKIFHYITTGDSQGDSQLSVAFSKDLGAPADKARTIANQYVQQCDAKIDNKPSGPATPDQATLQITQAAACDAIGGTVQGGLCHSTAKGSPGGADCGTAVVGFTPDGNIDPAALTDVKKQLPGCFR